MKNLTYLLLSFVLLVSFVCCQGVHTPEQEQYLAHDYLWQANKTSVEKAEERKKIIIDTYRSALDAGDKNVYYIDGESFFLKVSLPAGMAYQIDLPREALMLDGDKVFVVIDEY